VGKKCTVVVASADATSDNQLEALNAGAAVFLPKPVDFGLLKKKIKALPMANKREREESRENEK
jgi:DNA-binding response OmpR family regulator